MSSIGWWVAGVGNVQVGGVPLRERRWGSGGIDRCYNNEWLLVGVP